VFGTCVAFLTPVQNLMLKKYLQKRSPLWISPAGAFITDPYPRVFPDKEKERTAWGIPWQSAKIIRAASITALLI
jgi:hypothetical protein